MTKELIKAIKLNKDRYKEAKKRNEFACDKAIDDYTKEILKAQRKDLIEKIEKAKEETQNEGTFKYDWVYEEIINLIKKQ